tara:strand:- start:179 stop:1126 length:948 start_codon:yes stop_codon:yes gene_type:complete
MSSNKTAMEAEPGSGVNFDHPCEKDYKLTIVDRDNAIVTAEPKRTKVALVGFATSSRDMAPFDDPTYEIWTLNQIYRHVPRSTRHFDIHAYWEEDNVEGTDHRGWIRDCGIPVYFAKHEDGLSTTITYPLQKIIDKFGIDYFTSSVAFEVALAMYEGFEEIALYGIDLIVGTEYSEQKACLEFWLGLAHAKGINVVIPTTSALLKHSHRYGYERQPDWGPLRMVEMDKRIEVLSTEKAQKMALINALDGAIAEDERWFIKKIDELSPDERLKALNEQRGTAMATLATIDGAIQETVYWKELFTLRGRGAAVGAMA